MVDIVPHFEELAVHRAEIRALESDVDKILLRLNRIDAQMLERKGRRRMLVWAGSALLVLGNIFAWLWSIGIRFHISF